MHAMIEAEGGSAEWRHRTGRATTALVLVALGGA
jgi:hypothetical protein